MTDTPQQIVDPAQPKGGSPAWHQTTRYIVGVFLFIAGIFVFVLLGPIISGEGFFSEAIYHCRGP